MEKGIRKVVYLWIERRKEKSRIEACRRADRKLEERKDGERNESKRRIEKMGEIDES